MKLRKARFKKFRKYVREGATPYGRVEIVYTSSSIRQETPIFIEHDTFNVVLRETEYRIEDKPKGNGGYFLVSTMSVGYPAFNCTDYVKKLVRLYAS